MAGMKGRSGGARPGAGRKSKAWHLEQQRRLESAPPVADSAPSRAPSIAVRDLYLMIEHSLSVSHLLDDVLAAAAEGRQLTAEQTAGLREATARHRAWLTDISARAGFAPKAPATPLVWATTDRVM